MKRQFSACQTRRSMYPSIFSSFPVIRTASAKKSPFSRIAAHIFISPGDTPVAITQYVAWMERQFNACQTPRSMYLSIFNSFRVIRCLSRCVSLKIAIFTWGNHAKCCMEENSMLTNCLAECAHLTITVSQIERDIGWKSSFFSYPPCIRRPRYGPVGISPPRLDWKI